MDEKGFLSTVAAQLADVLCELGRYEEARDLIERSATLAAPDDVTSQTMWRTARSKVLAHARSLDEAETLARDALIRIEASDFLNEHAEALVQLAAVLSMRGRIDEADAVSRQAVALFERKGNVIRAKSTRRERLGASSASNPSSAPI
jgi:tetratricopeptide (TPR) repeat protein